MPNLSRISSRLPITVVLLTLGAVALSTQTGCITRRTVTQGDRVIEEKTVIKRPVKNLLQDIEIE